MATIVESLKKYFDDDVSGRTISEVIDDASDSGSSSSGESSTKRLVSVITIPDEGNPDLYTYELDITTGELLSFFQSGDRVIIKGHIIDHYDNDGTVSVYDSYYLVPITSVDKNTSAESTEYRVMTFPGFIVDTFYSKSLDNHPSSNRE